MMRLYEIWQNSPRLRASYVFVLIFPMLLIMSKHIYDDFAAGDNMDSIIFSKLNVVVFMMAVSILSLMVILGMGRWAWAALLLPVAFSILQIILILMEFVDVPGYELGFAFVYLLISPYVLYASWRSRHKNGGPFINRPEPPGEHDPQAWQEQFDRLP